MEYAEETSVPARNALVMLALAAGMWGLIYIAVVGLWPRHAGKSPIAIGDEPPSEVAVGGELPRGTILPDRPQLKSRATNGSRVKRRKRLGPSLAVRVFRQSTSLN